MPASADKATGDCGDTTGPVSRDFHNKKGLPKNLSPEGIHLEYDRTNPFSLHHALKRISDSAPNSPPILPSGVDSTPLETMVKLITVHLLVQPFDH